MRREERLELRGALPHHALVGVRVAPVDRTSLLPCGSAWFGDLAGPRLTARLRPHSIRLDPGAGQGALRSTILLRRECPDHDRCFGDFGASSLALQAMYRLDRSPE